MLCDCCDAALLGRPHPLVLQCDGAVEFRRVLCVRCREGLLPIALEALRAEDLRIRNRKLERWDAVAQSL
jgi:hypothetical protein